MSNKGIGLTANEKKWQIEDDLHALMRAAEINRDPKRLAAARALAAEKAKELQSVTKK